MDRSKVRWFLVTCNQFIYMITISLAVDLKLTYVTEIFVAEKNGDNDIIWRYWVISKLLCQLSQYRLLLQNKTADLICFDM